ncbi:insulin-like growth factor-binding protein complex acid labile subunit [Fopius arisanus]|uniref:Insulin-like growth factor-binding protein complex acid labile subunit n=1 Tax=Fopius arisanus TaxID=64838 RepID=A0A0C9QIN2_9HYME|nr:PREDICTED: insulin-like growth factor-binding protein complex acid labile subunit [Fopius arisanus]
MKIFFKVLICLWGVGAISADKCIVSVSYLPVKVEFTCVGLSTLNEKLNSAYKNTTVITIQDSNLMIIPSNLFSSFGITLKTLDIHESGVRSVDTNAFWGLVYLEKLSLWGNKLTTIPADWFTHLPNLRVLDLSFNNIDTIDYKVYYTLPNLNELNIGYNKLKGIDYNLFPVMTQLRKVEFGNNPLDWSYRVLLTWQLDNQRIDYRGMWDDWGWMSSAIQECQNNGYATVPDVKLLYCSFKRLVGFLNKNLSSGVQSPSLLNRDNLSVQAFTNLNQCVKSKVKVDGDLLSLKLLETLLPELRLIENPTAIFHRP